MTNSLTRTRPISGSTALAIFAAAMGLADVWLVAWVFGSIWGMALAAGTIVGLMLSTAWAIRRDLLGASIVLVLMSAGSAIALERCSPSAAILGAIVAFSIFGFWCLAELWLTGRAENSRARSHSHARRASARYDSVVHQPRRQEARSTSPPGTRARQAHPPATLDRRA